MRQHEVMYMGEGGQQPASQLASWSGSYSIACAGLHGHGRGALIWVLTDVFLHRLHPSSVAAGNEARGAELTGMMAGPGLSQAGRNPITAGDREDGIVCVSLVAKE